MGLKTVVIVHTIDRICLRDRDRRITSLSYKFGSRKMAQ